MVAPVTKKALEQLSVQLSVITPVQGGGVGWVDTDELRHVKKIDEFTPMRPSAVRGALRFWWRAIHGCTLGSLEEMWKQEAALWGAASQPGRVSLRIEAADVETGERAVFNCQERNGRWQPRSALGYEQIAYGSLGVQPKGGLRREPEPGIITELRGEIRLTLTAPTGAMAQVKDSLDAWLLFGGIGGRTRRGFGAVLSANMPPAETWLARLAGRAPTLDRVPSLRGARVVLAGTTHPKAEGAWKQALGKLQSFRQAANVGRNPPAPGSGKPAGRSRWPEPELVRELTGQSSPRHASRFVNVNKVPRAHFGLPIIFHFCDQDEPSDTTLKPADAERMASPLIVRPTPVVGGFRAMALLLSVPGPPLPLVLEQAKRSWPADPVLTTSEAAGTKPIAGVGRQDPLDAFMTYFVR